MLLLSRLTGSNFLQGQKSFEYHDQREMTKGMDCKSRSQLGPMERIIARNWDGGGGGGGGGITYESGGKDQVFLLLFPL